MERMREAARAWRLEQQRMREEEERRRARLAQELPQRPKLSGKTETSVKLTVGAKLPDGIDVWEIRRGLCTNETHSGGSRDTIRIHKTRSIHCRAFTTEHIQSTIILTH